jgi:hypothetical protein
LNKGYTGQDTDQGVIKFFDEMFNQIAYAASSENNNQKIPKFRDKNNTRGVLFTINSKNPNFSKPIVKAFLDQNVPADKETLPAAKVKAMQYVLDVLDLQVPQGTDLSKMDRINISDSFGEEVTINLSNPNQKANVIIGKMFGIKRDVSEPDSVEFIFPSILRVGAKTYVLQGTDGNAASGKSIGSNLYDSILGKTAMSIVGTYAKYKAIPAQYASEALSPIAFTSQDAEAYKRYVDKKEAIVFNTNIVDTSNESAPKAEIPVELENTVITGENLSAEDIAKQAPKEETEGISSESSASESQLQFGNDLLAQIMANVKGSQKDSEKENAVPKLQRGRYVTYNSKTYIITQQTENGTWQIYNPLLEGAEAKISVAEANMKPLDILAKIVEYKDAEYIVTSKNTIISLKTNKRMRWGENDGNRKAILALASQNSTIIKPNNRPSIDPTDENNC